MIQNIHEICHNFTLKSLYFCFYKKNFHIMSLLSFLTMPTYVFALYIIWLRNKIKKSACLENVRIRHICLEGKILKFYILIHSN